MTWCRRKSARCATSTRCPTNTARSSRTGTAWMSPSTRGCGTASRCRVASAPARPWKTTARSWRRCRRSTTSGSTVGAEHRSTLPASWRPAQFCHRESPFLTQLKVYGVYLIPKMEVQISGSFRSIPGQNQQNPPNNDVNVGFVATNAYLAANSTLGRPLSGGART